MIAASSVPRTTAYPSGVSITENAAWFSPYRDGLAWWIAETTNGDSAGGSPAAAPVWVPRMISRTVPSTSGTGASRGVLARPSALPIFWASESICPCVSPMLQSKLSSPPGLSSPISASSRNDGTSLPEASFTIVRCGALGR